jgi:hypothetical protein
MSQQWQNAYFRTNTSPSGISDVGLLFSRSANRQGYNNPSSVISFSFSFVMLSALPVFNVRAAENIPLPRWSANSWRLTYTLVFSRHNFIDQIYNYVTHLRGDLLPI